MFEKEADGTLFHYPLVM